MSRRSGSRKSAEPGRVIEATASPSPTPPLSLLADEPASAKPVARVEPAAQPIVQRTPMDILLAAIQDPSLDLTRLEKLMELQQRWTTEEARKAFVRDMALFKAEAPKIERNRVASVEKGGEVLYEYSYATLAQITKVAIPLLSKYGFSHSWSMEQANNSITVKCTLTHRDGYSLSVQLSSLYDNTGGKNPIQAIGSANSYLQRYTFLAVTGLSTADAEDDDGRGANMGLTPITKDQVDQIKDKLEELDGGAGTALLRYLKVDSIEEIPIQSFELALDLLGRRKRVS